MNVSVFLPKQDQDLPDSYGIDVQYLVGKDESFEVASHKIIKDTRLLEIVTTDDVWHLIPLNSIRCLNFDKRFSKIIAIKQSKTIGTPDMNPSSKGTP